MSSGGTLLSNWALAILAATLLSACAGQDENDTWVSVPISYRGGPTFPVESAVLPDLAARGIQPKEIICGVVRNDFNPDLIYAEMNYDRVYHFLVSTQEAEKLVASGKYIDRNSYDSTLPYTAIRCTRFGLFPPA